MPIPDEYALDPKIINRVIEKALKEARENNIQGKDITPFLLAKIAAITEGKSLKSSILLIRNV